MTMSVCAVRSAAMACICSALIAHSAYPQTSRQASTRIEGDGSFVLASAVGGFSVDRSAKDNATCSGDTSATNAEDLVLSVGAGGGVMIAFTPRPGVPKLDVSFRYLRGGEGTYLTKGAIRREGSAALLDLTRSRTDMVALYVGAVFGR
jgi:hypothetical protein